MPLSISCRNFGFEISTDVDTKLTGCWWDSGKKSPNWARGGIGQMNHLVKSLLRDESGAAAVEYGLLVVAIAAIIILTVFYFGGYVQGSFKTTCNAFSSADTGSNTSTVSGC